MSTIRTGRWIRSDYTSFDFSDDVYVMFNQDYSIKSQLKDDLINRLGLNPLHSISTCGEVEDAVRSLLEKVNTPVVDLVQSRKYATILVQQYIDSLIEISEDGENIPVLGGVQLWWNYISPLLKAGRGVRIEMGEKNNQIVGRDDLAQAWQQLNLPTFKY